MPGIFGTFWFIFSTVILPIFIQISAGFALQKKFKFDIRTLSQLQFFLFVPALLFIKIYQSDLSGSLVIQVLISTVMIYAAMAIVGFLIGLLLKFKKSMRNAFMNSVSLYNSGNYCIPLMQLLYNNDPFVMAVQAVIMATQNIITSTAGALISSSGQSSFKKALLGVLKIPMIYVAIAAGLLRGFNIEVWMPLVSTVDIISAGLVPTALFTLGAQLSEIKLDFSDYKIYLSSFLKLIIAPAISVVTVFTLGITGVAAQAIMIVSAAPTAVNVLILSLQYKNESEFTSKAVFASTVLSTITVTVVIYIAQSIFA